MKKIIKTQRLAGWLMYKGYTLLKTDKDKFNPIYDIYIFQYKGGIEQEIDNYSKTHKNKK